MIAAFRLSKAFGRRPVLRNVNLVVEPGTVTLLVGPNGAGKTTLLRIAAGLSEPDAGTAAIAGFDVRARPREAKARLSFLPQAPRFHARLNSIQVLNFYARVRGRPPGVAAAALEQWGLIGHAQTATGRLSGGLRQRLALAVVALADAPVLLLDEPGLSLDPEWRRRLQEHLFAAARRGRTVLVATHLLGEWEGHAHRCVVLAEGRVSGEISPERLREAFPWDQPHKESSSTFPASQMGAGR